MQMKVKMNCVFIVFCWLAIFCQHVTCEKGSPSLTQHFKSHHGLLADKWEQYLYIYDREFKQYHENYDFVNMLEIGVSYGGSLQIWKSYFGPNSIIVGVDIDTRVCTGANFEPGISVHCFDASNKELLTNFLVDRKFDIIIDDASHKSSDIINTFEIAFQLLNPQGVYVVEDIICAYMPSYEGGLLLPTSAVEYFKSLVDLVNSNYAFSRNSLNDLQLYLTEWIESIRFEDGIVIIKKRMTRRMRYNNRVLVGNEIPNSFSNVRDNVMAIIEAQGYFHAAAQLDDHATEVMYRDDRTVDGLIVPNQIMHSVTLKYGWYPDDIIFRFSDFDYTNNDSVVKFKSLCAEYCIARRIHTLWSKCGDEIAAIALEYMSNRKKT